MSVSDNYTTPILCPSNHTPKLKQASRERWSITLNPSTISNGYAQFSLLSWNGQRSATAGSLSVNNQLIQKGASQKKKHRRVQNRIPLKPSMQQLRWRRIKGETWKKRGLLKLRMAQELPL